MSNTPTATCSQIVTLPSIPELYDPDFLDVLVPQPTLPTGVEQKTPEPAPTNPMISALQSTAHQTLTTNLAATYDSTLSATLDAFRSVSHSDGEELAGHLSKSWAEDASLTLRIVWNLRSIHEGKSDREAFYRAFGWLYDNHPRTAIKNLPLLVEPVCTRPNSDLGLAHGYWKDLLNICTLATVDQLNSKRPSFLHHEKAHSKSKLKWKKKDEKNKKKGEKGDAAAHIEKSLKEGAEAKAKAKEDRALSATQTHERLSAKLAQPKFRALYIAVARIFSERLIKDLKLLHELDALPSGEERNAVLKQISLAAKWAPSPQAAHDRFTNLSSAIALLLHHSQATISLTFPSNVTTSDEPAKTHTLRSFYQRWVLTPLRKVSIIPEPLMSTNRWNEIKYTRVSSICMKNNTEHFFKHDPKRFEEYLISVESGKKQISGATLLPHELVAQALELDNSTQSAGITSKMESLREMREQLKETQVRVVEAQWKALVNRLHESGAIENSVAICDVSGSMGCITSKMNKRAVEPIFPALSLSLLLAQLAKPPFNNGFVTFSANPSYFRLDPNGGIASTVKKMVTSSWGMNTDLDAVFLKLLLPLAIENKVKPEDMIKRLFIFSDMQFDQGSSNADPAQWQTSHDVYVKAFEKAGYEMPEIVYWDLASHSTTPVTAERKGVALMNGFSPSMLKVFMGEEEEGEPWEEVSKDGESQTVVDKPVFNPLHVMKKALLKASFDGLVVID